MTDSPVHPMAIDAGGEGSGLVKKRVRRTAERQLTKKNEDALTARDAMSEVSR